MHRRPHDEQDGMKVWLSESEVEQYLDHVEDTTHRIARGLAFRCGLRTAEVIQATSADVVDGPAGTMLRVPDGKGGKYRETSLDHYRGTYSPEVQREARDGVEWL